MHRARVQWQSLVMHRQVRVAAAKLKFDLSAALPPPPPQTIDFEHFSISSTPSFNASYSELDQFYRNILWFLAPLLSRIQKWLPYLKRLEGWAGYVGLYFDVNKDLSGG